MILINNYSNSKINLLLIRIQFDNPQKHQSALMCMLCFICDASSSHMFYTS